MSGSNSCVKTDLDQNLNKNIEASIKQKINKINNMLICISENTPSDQLDEWNYVLEGYIDDIYSYYELYEN